jgi:DNA-directed RNA polymerase subunit RPC12/RpoP
MVFLSLFDHDSAGAGSSQDDVAFFCLRCGAHLQIEDGYAGKSCECPRCAQLIPVPALKEEAVQKRPDILAVEIEFLCPECNHKLSVEAGAGAMADCTWCGKEIEVPQLSELALLDAKGLSHGSHGDRRPPVETAPRRKPALLTQEELEFLSESNHGAAFDSDRKLNGH